MPDRTRSPLRRACGLRSRSGQARRAPPAPARAGFTLIELLITVALLALLATVATELVENSITRAHESDLRVALRDIRGAIDAYKAAADSGHIVRAANASGYPPNLAALVTGVADAKSASPRKLYFLRRLPRDPFADPALAPEETWGLRSFASDPDSPVPGDDVYDVYSTSTRIGLNGAPYGKW